MALRKITDAEISAKGVVAAPDVLNGTAAENKATFDRLVRELVAVCFNDLVDQLEALGVDAIIQTKSENMKYLRVVDGALQYSADGAKWAALTGGSGEGASGWPFGVLLESQNCTYTGVQYNEDVEMNRIGEAPADIRYLFDGEVSVTRGGVTKTVTIYDDILADEGEIPDGVDGVFLCNSLDGKRYNLYLRDAEICPDGEGLGCVNIIALADTWPAGIYVDISNGTDTARVNAITYAALSRVPMEYLDYDAATKQYVKDMLAGLPAASVELDATLTEEGKAADAKAVGDAIGEVKGSLDDITIGVEENDDAVDITVTTPSGTKTTEISKVVNVRNLKTANVFNTTVVTVPASAWTTGNASAGFPYYAQVDSIDKVAWANDVDVIVADDVDMSREVAKCQVLCYEKEESQTEGAPGTLYFKAVDLPTIDLTFTIRIWANTVLSYEYDSDTLTLTVSEE